MPVEITWWGHATATVRDSGVRVLTDPLFARRLAHCAGAAVRCRRRRRGPGGRGAGVPSARRPPAPGLAGPVAARYTGSLRAARRARGGPRAAPARVRLDLVEVAAGERRSAGELTPSCGAGRHDGRRLPYGPQRSPGARLRHRGRGADLLRRGHRAVRRHGRRGRAVSTSRCCRSAAGGRYLGEGHLDAARAAGRWPGWTPRAAPCRCTTARTGRSAWTRCGRTNSTPRARSSCGSRRSWRRRSTVHRLRARARACVWRHDGDGSLGRLAAGPMGALLAQPAAYRPTWPQALGYPTLFLLVSRGRWCRWCRRARWCQRGGRGRVPPERAASALVWCSWRRAAAAFLGDVALYWLGRRGVRSKNGSRWLDRLHRARRHRSGWSRPRASSHEHEAAVLVLSRLMPAGRIPVMLACLLAEMPLRRSCAATCRPVWRGRLAYQLIGILAARSSPSRGRAWPPRCADPAGQRRSAGLAPDARTARHGP